MRMPGTGESLLFEARWDQLDQAAHTLAYDTEKRHVCISRTFQRTS